MSAYWLPQQQAGSTIGLVFDSNNLHFRSRICVRVGKPLYAADYGLNADSNPHEMHAMRKDIMDSIKSMVEENPPFPILHDVPKHRTSIEIAQDKKRAALEQKKQAEQAADTTEE